MAGQRILCQEVYPNLSAVPAPAEVIDIFRTSEAALQVVRDAIAVKDVLKASVVWMQLGVINEAAAAEARAGGLTEPVRGIALLGGAARPRHPDVLFFR